MDIGLFSNIYVIEKTNKAVLKFISLMEYPTLRQNSIFVVDIDSTFWNLQLLSEVRPSSQPLFIEIYLVNLVN